MSVRRADLHLACGLRNDRPVSVNGAGIAECHCGPRPPPPRHGKPLRGAGRADRLSQENRVKTFVRLAAWNKRQVQLSNAKRNGRPDTWSAKLNGRPGALRAELVRRFAFAAGKDRSFASRRNPVTPA